MYIENVMYFQQHTYYSRIFITSHQHLQRNEIITNIRYEKRVSFQKFKS